MEKQKKKRGNKRSEKKGVYGDCWKFLIECKKYFLIISLIFVFSLFVGYFLPIGEFSEQILEYLKSILEQTEGMSFLELLFFIIKNNVFVSFVAMVFGILLGVIPLINSVLNGYILGFVMNKTAEVAGGGVLWRLLPHGIFEIPALIISLGLGVRLGMFVFAKNKKKDLIYTLKNSLKVFFFIIIPLLLIAGLVETLLIFILP